jgi:hypothetical protein
MITLAADCLVFQMAGGEQIPFSADMISVELMGETVEWFDAEMVKHAAKAVFHYFKHEAGRQTVTVGEFTEALEKALRAFRPTRPVAPSPPADPGIAQSDLSRLALESGPGRELFFFPRLRDELRQQLLQGPRVLRFHGLRGCVKQLVGVRRWSMRCVSLEEQIVSFLRECLKAEGERKPLALLVE